VIDRTAPQKQQITAGKFSNVDLRVARVLAAPRAEGTRYPSRVLRIDVGHLGERTSVGQYALIPEDELVGLHQAVTDDLTSLGPEALLGSFAILCSAVIYAFNIIVMRRQAQHAGPIEIAFFQNLVIGFVLMMWAAVSGVPQLPAGHWGELVLAAGLAIGSLMLLGWGYARAGAAYLSTTEYTSFLWAMLLGWLRFGEHVSLFTLLGASLIVAGCLAAARTRKVDHPALEATA